MQQQFRRREEGMFLAGRPAGDPLVLFLDSKGALACWFEHVTGACAADGGRVDLLTLVKLVALCGYGRVDDLPGTA